MTISEYAALAQRTASTFTRDEKIGHGMLGLMGESGEVIDIIKKMEYMGLPNTMAKEMLKDEFGDVLWYAVELCVGSSLEVDKVFDDALTGAELTAMFLPPRDELRDLASQMLYSAVNMYRTWRNVGGKEAIRIGVYSILTALFLMSMRIDTTFYELMDINISKLRSRYGDSFDADKSNARYGL